MGMTLTEKIIARAAGLPVVRPGDVVTCAVDLLMVHDSSGPRRHWPKLKELGAGIWDPDKVVIVSDHYVPAVDAESAGILKLTRDFAAAYGIRNFHDMRGICHLVLPEQRLLKPGMFVAGGDSHSTTGGAFGCYMAGFGATETLGVLVLGEIWTKVPQTIRVEIAGRFGPLVTAKDLMLHLCRRLGMDNAFKAVEFAGPAVSAMAMLERLVLTNMAAELGAEAGLIAPDAVTLGWLGEAAPADALSWQSDADASFEQVVAVDAAALSPQVAAPHSPANSAAAADHAGQRIDQAYVGACVGAKISDLRMAAAVLKGRRVAPGVRLLVAPASAATTAEAAADGTLAALAEAGAILLPSGCGACAGYGAGILADGEVCISTTNRNFKGRMGSALAEVWLASPYTVAAAAVAGHILDPREVLAP